MQPEPFVLEARKRLRNLPREVQAKITPRISISFGQSWARALEIDPKGRELNQLIDDLIERLK